jgi:alpha-ketoglutarate-dependent taurine dioxygenase
VSLTVVELDGDVVRFELADGTAGALHALALRDTCRCGECRLPSGQRLFESHDVLPGLGATFARIDGDDAEIGFTDRHVAVFPASAIRAELEAARSGHRPRRPLTLWDAELDVPEFTYDDVVEDDGARRAWLAAVAELGVAVVRAAPAVDRTVAKLAELFSPVRVTNYGRIFDVRVKVDASNLADSQLGLSLHTDNPYRVPQPTLQLLHCLSSSASGGDTLLSDGFRAVEALRHEDAAALRVLAEHPVRYRYADASADLTADVPVVSLDVDGRPVSLQVNNRSKGTPTGRPVLVERWYAAYFRLHQLLGADDACVRLRLEDGDAIVFDNGRVLHGRTAFTAEGSRWLQGCYADRDALLSTLAVLEREGVRVG